MLSQKAENHFQLSTKATAHTTHARGESFRPSDKETSAKLRLVDSILVENNCLNRQLKQIEAQVMKARPLSLNLLKENESMRSLYHQRTQDIKKIIQTISINSQENRTDQEHQCFLFKQLNCSTLKQIKVLDRQRQVIRERVSEINQLFQQLSLRKNQLQHESLTKLKVRLGKGVRSEPARTLAKQHENQQNELLQAYSQVNQLLIQTGSISRQIAELKRNREPQRQQLTDKREQYQYRIADAKNHIKAYLQVMKNDKQDYQRDFQEKSQKQEKAKKISKAMSEEIRKYEKLQNQWTRLNEERQKTKERINLSSRNKEKIEQKLETVKDQRHQLQQTIKQKKQGIQRFIYSQNEKAQTNDKTSTEAVKKLKSSINASLNQNNSQNKKLKAEKLKFQKLIEGLSQEYQTLQDEVQEYSRIIAGYPNPIAQIQRIQLIFRLKNAR